MQNFSAKRIVIKIGSSLLVENGALREKWLQELAQDVAKLVAQKIEVVIVSSGAIALGRRLWSVDRKLTLPEKQAAAAVGQIELMGSYHDYFCKHQTNVAQILLSAADCNARERYTNSQNTINTLLAKGIVPIINENDTVAVDEIKIGDNDRLAARVAQMISADLLILFSDIDGLYDKNPKIYQDAKLISEVKKITKNIEEMAGGSSSLVGTGGMITKIVAAKMAVMAGCETIITNGLVLNPLQKLIFGEQNYTIFRSRKIGAAPLKSRKKWLSGFLNARGEVAINKCASEAMSSKKISLLPIGITNVAGDFKIGDLVFVKDEDGNHIASGTSNYGALEAKKIIGKNSDEIKKIFGESAKTEFIHIDNLILI